MCQPLDALVIVTADHGLVDVQWRFLADCPELESCLVRMPSIESRAMSFFIKPGMESRFETAFEKHFGDCYLLLSKAQVLDKRLFGEGVPHPLAAGFIGDYLAIATGGIGIECAPPAQHHPFKAAHAGLTKAEMHVPFIAAECI